MAVSPTCARTVDRRESVLMRADVIKKTGSAGERQQWEETSEKGATPRTVS